MENMINSLLESMLRHIGQTVTIFTTSGGLSGDGFTGVLMSVDINAVKLLVDIGAAPACPIGSNCGPLPGSGGFGGFGGYGGGFGANAFGVNSGNPLGAVVVIPTCSIAAFTRNAI